jgi:hypothetical protein
MRKRKRKRRRIGLPQEEQRCKGGGKEVAVAVRS